MYTFNVTQFARIAGVSVKTLQCWDHECGLKPAANTHRNQRLYTHEQLNKLLMSVPKAEQVTIVYRRVSNQAQKPDLANRIAVLEQFCISGGIAIDEWISEIGGCLNFRWPKFSDLVDGSFVPNYRHW